MDTGPTISQSRLAVEILAIVSIGIPLLAYIWETANQLLAGIVSAARLAMTVPMVGILVLLLFLMRRAVRRLEIERETNIQTSRKRDQE